MPTARGASRAHRRDRVGGLRALRLRPALALLGLAALASCVSTNLPPIGKGSRQFRAERDEQQLWSHGEELERGLEKAGRVYDEPSLGRYLNGVAERLLAGQLAQSGAEARVRVIKDPLLNAFALPNGTIFLHTGILARMENEAQLATVLGHELVHFTHRHGVLEMRRARNRIVAAHVTTALLAALAAGSSGDPQAAASFAELGQSVLSLWTAAAITGYSRVLETEADERGLEALLAAGYDPAESTKVFQQMKRELDAMGVAEPYFFGSHPRLDERIENYRRLLAKREAPGDHPRKDAEIYSESVSGVLLENAKLDLAIGRIETARAALARHLAGRPESAPGHFLMGELHRRSGRGEAETAAAVEAYLEAIRLDPDYAEPHRALGMLYRGRQRADAARAEFTRYLELAPDAVDRPIIEGYRAGPVDVAAPPRP